MGCLIVIEYTSGKPGGADGEVVNAFNKGKEAWVSGGANVCDSQGTEAIFWGREDKEVCVVIIYSTYHAASHFGCAVGAFGKEGFSSWLVAGLDEFIKEVAFVVADCKGSQALGGHGEDTY